MLTFELVNSNSITDAIFGETSFNGKTLTPLSDKLLMNSYQTSNFIYNMGSSFYYIVIYLVLLFLALVLTAVNRKCFGSLLIMKLTEYTWNIFPSLSIRFFIQKNYELLLDSYIQLNVIRWTQKWADYISAAFAITSLIICITIPVFFAAILCNIKK